MGEGLFGHGLAALADRGDRLFQINRVPENDGGDYEVQPACAMPLVFMRSIPELPEPVEEHGPCQGIFRLAFVEPDMNATPQFGAADGYARKRGWTVAVEVKDVGSGATTRPLREKLIETARRREIDSVIVWRLDRWGRSLVDLVNTLQELTALDVGFVSLSEALDLTTPSGRALAGMLAVFAEFERDILRDRVKAGIDQARKDGKPHGRPMTAGKLVPEMKQLRKDGISKRAIAKQLGVSRTSVIRLLRSRKRS